MIERWANERSGKLLFSPLLFRLLFSGRRHFPAVGADQQPPRSYSQELENAAVLFADSQYEAAGRRFAELSKVPTNSAFVRGLAGIGIAETALARKETGTALQAWEHLVKDASLPVWQRELAQRRIAETERLAKGLPERDPVAYRTRLPALPDAAAVYNQYGDFQERAFTQARRLGVKTCVGTEIPLGIPKGLAARLEAKGMKADDPVVIRRLYEGTFLRLKRKMPIDYFWFWAPEIWLGGERGCAGWEITTRTNVERDLAIIEAAAHAVQVPFGFATCGWRLGSY